MSDSRAISGDFFNYRRLPSRKVIHLIIEIPEERQQEVFSKLGCPIEGQTLKVAVCRIETAQSAQSKVRETFLAADRKDKTDMEKARDYAYVLARKPSFIDWACAVNEENAAEFIKVKCGVSHRSEIATNPYAFSAFNKLVSQYIADTGHRAEVRG